MGLLHLCDVAWFGGAWLIDNPPPEQQALMKRFILLDLMTVFGIVLAAVVSFFHFGFGDPFIFQLLCFVVLLVVGLVDLYWNKSFYFSGKIS
jgi:putative copper export protein